MNVTIYGYNAQAKSIFFCNKATALHDMKDQNKIGKLFAKDQNKIGKLWIRCGNYLKLKSKQTTNAYFYKISYFYEI